jgi:hypothetical protein
MWASGWGRPGLVGALFVGFTACSVTDYRQPITTFATATQNAETALNSLNREVTDAHAAQLRQKAIAGEALVEKEGCLAESEHCSLNLHYRPKDNKPDEPLTPPAALGHMVALMASITTYADNLVTLVGADTATKVTTNVNSTLGSIGSLASTVETVGAAQAKQANQPKPEKQPVDLSAFKTPVGDAASWIVGQYVASVKLEGLKRATTAAQPVIAKATNLLQFAAKQAAIEPRATMAEDVTQRFNAFESSRTQQNLQQLIQSANQLNQFLEAKPSDVFAKMNDAHKALTDQLQGKNVTLPEAIAKIETFAAEAESLSRIAKSFVAAASKKET